jgi:hypothetical protein
MMGALFTACENGDWEFPDYKYSAVYFAYQSPIRTITLGEDKTVDNSWTTNTNVRLWQQSAVYTRTRAM